MFLKDVEMKFGALTSCFLLSTLVLLLLSTAAQATEYREVNTEVKAEDILKHIEQGDDIYLDNCSIVEELSLSKIELKTVPVSNPKHHELLVNGVDEEEFGDYGIIINNDLKVVDSNIEIYNSTFENNLDFSSCLFNKSLSFAKVNCSSTANFGSTTFGNSIYFYNVTFRDSANFCNATFGDSVVFEETIFGGSADFSFATFGDSADFSFATFKNPAYFDDATFGNSASFVGATFEDPAYFYEATFGDSLMFFGATFGDSAIFSYSTFGDLADFDDDTFAGTVDFSYATFAGTVDFSYTEFERVILDETDFKKMRVRWNSLENSLSICEYGSFNSHRLTYIKLISNFRNLEQFDDADSAYFQYRQICQAENPWISFLETSTWISFPKVGDIFMWLSCGYGVKPSYAVGSSTFIIFLFSAIYSWEDLCSKGLKKYFDRRFSEFSSIISRLRRNRGKNILNLSSWIYYLKALFHWHVWDALYFSIASFTNSSYEDWVPGDYGRKLAVLEGFIGNLLIALFIVTLVNVLIKPSF